MTQLPFYTNAQTAKAASEILDTFCYRGPSSERLRIRRLAEALFDGRQIIVNSAEVS
jgi:hypothetical protein